MGPFVDVIPPVPVYVSVLAAVIPSSTAEFTIAFAPLAFGRYPVVSEVDVVFPPPPVQADPLAKQMSPVPLTAAARAVATPVPSVMEVPQAEPVDCGTPAPG